VQFRGQLREGGEHVLHGDPASEAFLSDVLARSPGRAKRHASIESLFEYGSRAGFWRCGGCSPRRMIPVTVFGVGPR